MLSSPILLVLGMIQFFGSVQFLLPQPVVDGLALLLPRRQSWTCSPRLPTTRPSLSSSMASGHGHGCGCGRGRGCGHECGRQPLFLLARPLQAKATDEEGDDNDNDDPISEDEHVRDVHVETALDEADDPGPASTSTSTFTFTLMTVLRTVGNLVLELWSAVLLFLGACFTLGLLLNLLGYGYRFDKTEFLHVDTLENVRTERQFQQVSRRYFREYSNSKMIGGDVGVAGSTATGAGDSESVPVHPK